MNDKKREVPPVRTKADNNNPFSLPTQVKRPRSAVREDQTSQLGMSLAEGRVSRDHEPWFSNMVRRYGR